MPFLTEAAVCSACVPSNKTDMGKGVDQCFGGDAGSGNWPTPARKHCAGTSDSVGRSRTCPVTQPAVKQALVDAGERYNAAGGSWTGPTRSTQYGLARETALEGLAYIRAARTALGLDPGPDLPRWPLSAASAGSHRSRELDVEGHVTGPRRSRPGHPVLLPRRAVQGRPVPAGWYSEPWWRSALATGAGVLGGLLLFDALSGGFGGGGGFDQGYDQGFDQGFDQGVDSQMVAAATAVATTAVATTAPGDYGGDYGGGGDFGGGGAFEGGFGGFGGGDF